MVLKSASIMRSSAFSSVSSIKDLLKFQLEGFSLEYSRNPQMINKSNRLADNIIIILDKNQNSCRQRWISLKCKFRSFPSEENDWTIPGNLCSEKEHSETRSWFISFFCSIKNNFSTYRGTFSCRYRSIYEKLARTID